MVNPSYYKIHQFAYCIISIAITITTIHAEESASSLPQSIALPVGHLKPLGSHRPPDVHIDDLQEVPNPQEFLEKYVRQERAAIFRGASKQSPAFKLWKDEYLKEKYGNLQVRLEGKKEKGAAHTPHGDKGIGRSTIGHFIDHYHTTNRYMVSELPTPMYPEFFVPPCLSCGLLRERLVEIDVWMSGKNSQSVLHKDAFNSLNCLLNGTKQWKLFERKYEKWLHKAWEPDYEIGGYSEINVNRVDMLKHPNITNVPWSNFTINAGDCIFLPSRYYHQVTSIGETNLAVAVLFSFNLPSHDDHQQCEETKPEYLPLSNYDVSWQWRGDDGYMTMGHSDIWELRDSWVQKASADGALSMEDLMQEDVDRQEFHDKLPDHATNRELVEKVMLHYGKLVSPLKKFAVIVDENFKGWKYIDPENKGRLNQEDISNLSPEALRQFVLATEHKEPSNGLHYEYFYVKYEEVKYLFEKLLEKNGFITREKFYTIYQEVLGGSEEYAKQIFDKLTNDSTIDKAVPDDIAKNLEVALAEYKLRSPSATSYDDTETNEPFTSKDEL